MGKGRPRPPYWQVIPGGQSAANAPSTVTVRALLAVLAAVKVNVPRTAVVEELVITSSPDVAANISMDPETV